MSTTIKTKTSEAIGNEPDGEEDTEMNRLMSARSVKRPRLRTITTNTGDVLNECVNSRSAGILTDGNEIHSDLYSFVPIHIIFEWEDEREERCVTVATLMPSGSFETPRDHELRVSDDRNNLGVTVVWP